MKRSASRIHALVLVAGLTAAMPSFSQTTTPASTGVSGTTGTTMTADRRSDGFDWGLLGLLGLAGLLGLRRRDDSADAMRNRTTVGTAR